MNRFFREALPVESGGTFRIELDGKPVMTPGRRTLEVPTGALAEAIAGEWADQGETIKPETMSLTQLANSAIDRVRPSRELIIEELTGYGGTDLLCYRVDNPPDLKSLQDEEWQPLLDWLEAERGIALTVTRGITPVEQDEKAILGVYSAVAAHDDFRMAGLYTATSATGSVVLALALSAGRVDADAAWSLAFLDELHQESLWGHDTEAGERRENLKTVIADADRFMRLAAGQG